jgi:serine/threonine-protein kinase
VLPRIERYEISNEIGHGGMATVYRALDQRLQRWVAVKVMHPHLRGTDEARARFAREARAVARLKHPAILEIYDYSGSDSDDAYIATELLTGPTLKAFVDGVDEVPGEIAACIGVELASGLAAAHAEGIIHRDVKPENVLLHQGRDIKLTDFGIADMLDPSMSHMTATGQLLGSPAHMAPEQVEGGDADARSDVFAVGTILYWLATGSLPFSGKNPHQVLKRVVDCAPVEPLLVRPAIGAPLRNIIMRCLQKNPDQRYQSAAELSVALRALLVGLGVEEPKRELEAYLRDPRAESQRLRGQVLERLLAAAEAAVAARDRNAAVEALDRVLALDDGNARALGLLRELDQRKRLGIVLRAAAALCAVSGLFGLWFAFAPASGANSVAPPVKGVPAAPPGAASGPAGASGAEFGSPGLPSPPGGKVETVAAQARAARPAPRARATGPRTVVFDPEPANVTISVDGEAAQAFGPSFSKVELAPGRHSFRFVGAEQCCEDAVVELDVPPGPGESVVRAHLAFRDARLYVSSNVPANVALDDAPVGRALSLISVPMERNRVMRRKISVTAPGHDPYTGHVQLRAGEVAQLEIALVPSAPL